MAIMPLQFQGVDIGGSVSRGLNDATRFQQAQQAQLETRRLDDMQNLRSISLGALELRGLPPEMQLARAKKRRADLIADNRDPAETDEFIAALEQDPSGNLANQIIDQTINTGKQFGVLQSEDLGRERLDQQQEQFENRLEQEKAIAEQNRNIQQQRVDLQAQQNQRQQTADAATQAFRNRQLSIQQEANRLKAKAKNDKQVNEIETAQKKETQKLNVKRIAELNQGKKARDLNTRQAKLFLTAFKEGGVLGLDKGELADSGTSRTVASLIPGVFTQQGEFDQKFNAFAEVAARQKLKASGETKPTDADVEGMKRAMFGVGRDEATNIQLLSDYITEQEALNAELNELQKAKKSGKLDSFSGGEGSGEVKRFRYDPTTGDLI